MQTAEQPKPVKLDKAEHWSQQAAAATMMRLTFTNNCDDDNNEDRTITGDEHQATRSRLLLQQQQIHHHHQRHQNKPLRGLDLLITVSVIWVCLGAAIGLVSGQLYEGSTCKTRNGTYGLCKVHRHCVWAMNGYRDRSFSAIDMVRCGFKGNDELVCCLDEMPDQSTTEANDEFIFDNGVLVSTLAPTPAPPVPVISPSPAPPIRSGERRSVTECARFNKEYSTLDFHILGGEETNLGDFPHMAALGYPSTDETAPVEWRCGGSLVSENYVLTAAHCLTRTQPTVVRLGQVSLLANMNPGEAQDIPIAQIIMHPDYIPSRNYNDIALLRIAENVTITEFVTPACLRTTAEDVPNESLIVTGWGDTSVERRERSNILLKTNLTAVELNVCNQSYAEQPRDRRLPNLLNRGQLCANDPNQKNDACQGDSGGPLQIRQANNFHMIVGVTSFGTSCGSLVPGVYARVAFYIDWLESVLWPN